jgi:hypothetical protein
VERWGRLDRPIQFLAVGHVAIDWRGSRRTLGGAAAYGGLTAHRLGLATAIVTAVGRDFDLFEGLPGVEIRCRRGDRSTAFENLYEAGRRKQRLLGRAPAIGEPDLLPIVPELADDAIVFYCPLARELYLPLRRLVPRGLSGVAAQGFLRRWNEAGVVSPAPWTEAPKRLAEVDVLVVSETDPPDLDDFVRTVASQTGLLAVTRGAHGARLHRRGSVFSVPAFMRPEVDPTGAGDVFAAALLVALREGRDAVESARWACTAASFAVENEGLAGVPAGRPAVESRWVEYCEVHRSKGPP